MKNNNSAKAQKAMYAQQLAKDIVQIKEFLGEMYVNRIAPAHRPADDDVEGWTLQGAIDVLIKAANHILSSEGLPEYRPKLESNCRLVSAEDAMKRMLDARTVLIDLNAQPHQIHE